MVRRFDFQFTHWSVRKSAGSHYTRAQMFGSANILAILGTTVITHTGFTAL